ARAARAAETDWAHIDRLYATLEQLQPSPVVTLNRSVAVAKVAGAEAALALIEPLAAPLSGYFYYYGVRGALLEQLGRTAEARHALTGARGLPTPAAGAPHTRMLLDNLADRAPADRPPGK